MMIEGDQQADHSPFFIAAFFVAGALFTAAFSASLAKLTTKAGLTEVLAVGLIVPSFTWLVQLALSAILLKADARRKYHAALGRVCLLGSLALLPAALANFLVPHVTPWLSAANVLASVALMAADLFRRSAAQKILWQWPASWCVTIVCNIAIFLWVSRSWWGSAVV